MAKVSQVSPEVLASMRSSEGSNDTRPGTTAQELCVSREPEAPQQTRLSASSQRFTIPDPSDTYLAPQFQESFNQVARATMEEINRTTGRTLGRIVPSQRRDQSSNSSERAPPHDSALGDCAWQNLSKVPRGRYQEESDDTAPVHASSCGASSSLPERHELEPRYERPGDSPRESPPDHRRQFGEGSE